MRVRINKMKHADEIKQLTKKLKEQGDILLEEADWIFSLFSEHSQKTKLNPHSFTVLMLSLEEWYYAVTEKIKNGCRGNFLLTIPLSDSTQGLLHLAQKTARDAIKEYGYPEDIFRRLMIDQRIYSSLPEKFQKLFVKEFVNVQYESFYVLLSPRVGFDYYPLKELKNAEFNTISQFMKKFSPIISSRDKCFFEIASGARGISEESWFISGRQTYQYVIAAYIQYKNLPCMVRTCDDIIVAPKSIKGSQYVFFTEKDKAQIVKDAMKITMEDLAANALNRNIIDKTTAQEILKNPVWAFPIVEFTKASIKYIDDIAQRKLEWKTARKAVEDEPNWLEETR